MKCLVVVFLVLSLLPTIAFGQTPNQKARRGTLRICKGVPIPDGYMIVAYESSASCPHGAYVIKKDDGSPAPAATTKASRPRKVENTTVNSIVLNQPIEISTPYASPPTLQGSL